MISELMIDSIDVFLFVSDVLLLITGTRKTEIKLRVLALFSAGIKILPCEILSSLYNVQGAGIGKFESSINALKRQ